MDHPRHRRREISTLSRFNGFHARKRPAAPREIAVYWKGLLQEYREHHDHRLKISKKIIGKSRTTQRSAVKVRKVEYKIDNGTLGNQESCRSCILHCRGTAKLRNRSIDDIYRCFNIIERCSHVKTIRNRDVIFLRTCRNPYICSLLIESSP